MFSYHTLGLCPLGNHPSPAHLEIKPGYVCLFGSMVGIFPRMQSQGVIGMSFERNPLKHAELSKCRRDAKVTPVTGNPVPHAPHGGRNDESV